MYAAKRWGAAVACLAATLWMGAGVARADSASAAGSYGSSDANGAPWPGDLTEVPADEDAFAEYRAPNRGVGFLASLGSTVISAVVFPVKLFVGVGGAALGGVAGAMSGGDEEAAAGIWNVTTDGSYFVSPQVLENRRTFHAGGVYP